MDVLECKHAVLVSPTLKAKDARRCGQCHQEMRQKEAHKDARLGTPLQQLQKLVKALGQDVVLEALAKQESAKSARIGSLKKARSVRWSGNHALKAVAPEEG